VQTETEEIQLTIKRGLLDNRQRQLIINSDFIKFEDKDLLSALYTRFERDSIKDFRFGIKWIRGFEFTIGREYQIFIRNQDNRVLKINFKSLYGHRRKEYHKLYAQIIDSLWNFYFLTITDNLIDKFNKGEKFSIANVLFSENNLTIIVSRAFKEEKKEISWNKVGKRDYQTYFAIFSLDDPNNINRGYSYLDDWNTAVLKILVLKILNSKNTSTSE